MKVKDLIEELSKMPEDAIVICQASNTMELGTSLIPVEYVHETHGKIESREFIDAFDYTRYRKEVFSYNTASEQIFVRISD